MNTPISLELFYKVKNSQRIGQIILPIKNPMDKTSEALLNYFIDWLAQSPILLILLYRPEYTHQWGSKSYYTKIGLSQFTSQSSAELIRAILYDCEIEPEKEIRFSGSRF